MMPRYLVRKLDGVWVVRREKDVGPWLFSHERWFMAFRYACLLAKSYNYRSPNPLQPTINRSIRFT